MTARHAWRGLTLALAAAALIACGSGGGDDGERPGLTARQALARAQGAFERRDAAALCGLLSQRAKLVIGHAQHGSVPLECHKDLAPFLKWIRPYPKGERARLVALEKPAPDRAVARFRLPGGELSTLRLRRHDGGWSLDGLFDATLGRLQLDLAPDGGLAVTEEQLLERSVEPSPMRAPGVVVSDAAGHRCRAVDRRRFPELAGGCVVDVSGRTVRLSVRTPFGAMRFGRCRVTLGMRMDGTGRAWVSDFEVDGDSPCSDVLPCLTKGARIGEMRMLPWQATVRRVAASRMRIRIREACVDTCVGRFSGRWTLDVVERPRGWRARSDGMVGTSGWHIDGAFASRAGGVVVAERPGR